MITIALIPVWYWVVAVLFSAYYAFRGWVGNRVAARVENEKRSQSARYDEWVIKWVFSAHDALFHFVCSMAGFCALFVANTLYESLIAGSTFDAARSVLLVFTFLFGLVGVTGQLPQLILQGKFPGLR